MKRTLAMACAIGVALAALTACGGEKAVEWRPAGDRIMTRWAAEVGPENALPEYPRPQMVREDWLNLNGLWDYAIVAKDADRPSAWAGKILVPFAAESALSGVGEPVGPARALWYRRTVDIPKGWRKGRVLLHFGAVDWESTVWVNGREMGTHRGGYDPFSYDITDDLKRGARQEIVLRVLDPTDADNSPIARGKQVLKPRGIFYTAVTGIWQTAWLEPVPASRIDRLGLTPDIDRGTLTVRPVVAGPGDGLRLAVKVGLRGADVASAEGPADAPLVVSLPSAELWSPDAPVLYDLRASLVENGQAVDEVTSYAGMRKISVAKDGRGFNRLLLNNEPLFELGPLDQGWWPDGLYTAPTDAALRSDIEAIKSLGMNMLRKHVKVEPDRLYYWCDKLGLLVWQDMPSALFRREAHGPEVLAARDAQFESEWKAVMDALGAHPSIVMWVPFNEGWGQYDTERIVAATKARDPSRLVNNASGWTDKGVGDVADIHSYPGPAMPPVEEGRAAVLGEFGGLGLPITGHLWQAEGNWGYRNFDDVTAYEARYADLIKNLYPLVDKGLAAAVYTQTSDCEIEVNGLLTYDREVLKLDPARFSALNRGFLPPRFVAEETQFVDRFMVIDLSVPSGATVRVTTDGSEPTPESGLFQEPLVITGDTTVKARAFWPDGTASLIESRAFRRATPEPAVAAPDSKGLAYEYIEGSFEKLADMSAIAPARTGTATRPDLAVAGDRKERYALRFRGFIRAPRTGVYVFSLGSDDGSRLAIAGRDLIVNDGAHSVSEEKGEIALAQGWHPIEVTYFQVTGPANLDLAWRGPGFGKRAIPAGAYGH